MTISESLEKYLEARHAYGHALANLTSAEEWLVDAMMHAGDRVITGNMFHEDVDGYNVKVIRTDGRWSPVVAKLKNLPVQNNGTA